MRESWMAIAGVVALSATGFGGVDAVSASTRIVADTANPLLAEWAGPYGGVPPWDQVKPGLFPAAFETGIETRRAEIRAITDNTAPATFQNTIVPLENAGRQLDRVQVLFAVMTNNMNSPEYQALDREWSPRLAAAYDEIVFNEKLFGRIEDVYEARAGAGLTAEQNRLVERTYEQLVRAGAKLDAEGKAELGRINQRLAALFSDFSTRVLKDEDTWTLITDYLPRGRGRARTYGLGGGQYALECGPLPDVRQQPCAARAGLDEVQDARRQQ